MTTFTTTGRSCGGCGHTHYTIRTALGCLGRDRRERALRGERGDRRIVYGDGLPLRGADLDDERYYLTKEHATREARP